MRDIVVRKRALDQDFVCSTFFVPEGNYRFTLEGCNEYAEGIIRNAKGDVVAILKGGESVDIARRGKYLICIQGRNAVGTIWTEWIVPPATDNKEYCCDELRATDEVLRAQIEGVKDKIKNIQEVVVEAGVNVTVTQEGNTYTVNAVDTIPDVDKAYVDAKIAAIEDKDTITTVSAGDNVTVTQTGNDYKISAVDTKPDVDKAYVDAKIAAIEDKDTITTVSAGDNVTVTQTGNDYRVSAVDTVTTVKAGVNVTVTKSGNEYTVSATDTIPDVDKAYVDAKIAAIVDSDTITTVKAGANVMVTQSGNEYTVNAADTITTLKAGANVTITQSGNEYTVNTDVNKAYVDDKIANIQDNNTITTVSAGKNIGITKTGDDYEVKTLDDVEFNKVKLSASTNSVSAENLIQPINYSLKLNTDTGTFKSVRNFNAGVGSIQLSFKEERNSNGNTTLVNDDKVEIYPTYIQFTVDGEEAPAGGSVLGLGNKTFDPANITSGRAATEDQLVALKNSIESNIPTPTSATTVSAGKNIGVTKTGDNYEVKTLDNVKFNLVESGPNTVGDSQFYWRSNSMGTLFSIENPRVEQSISYTPYGFTGTVLDKRTATNGETYNFSITNLGYTTNYVNSENVLVSQSQIYHDYIHLKNRDSEILLRDGNITGLINKTFDPLYITSGRAATEDQLVALKNNIESNLSDNDTFHFTETSEGGIYRSKSFFNTKVYQNSMSLAQYDGTRNYGKSSIYLSEIDPTTRYYKFAEDYVPGTKQVVVSLEDIGFPYNDITVENILKYPVRIGSTFYNPTDASIDNENKTITITIDRARNTNDGWKTGDKIPLGTTNYGNGSFVSGAQNYGAKSIVAGNDPTINKGNFSLVVGNSLYNGANDAIIGGYLNRNGGQNSIVSGRGNNNLAERSFLMGNENKNSSTAATDSVVFGVKNENTKSNSFVFGTQNKNEGGGSFVGGGANTNTAINSFIYGTQCKNTGMMNVLFGLGHDSSQGGGYLFACGYHSEITGNTLFAVGNGQETAKKNALEIRKDGVVACGYYPEITSNTLFAVGNGSGTAKKNALEIGKDGNIYLRSPNGTKFILAVDDSGTLTVTPAT